MGIDYHLLYDYLSDVHSKEYVEKIIKGIKNPAKYPWMAKELTLIYQNFQSTEEVLMDKKLIISFTSIFITVIVFQCDSKLSKCVPLKDLKYSSNLNVLIDIFGREILVS